MYLCTMYRCKTAVLMYYDIGMYRYAGFKDGWGFRFERLGFQGFNGITGIGLWACGVVGLWGMGVWDYGVADTGALQQGQKLWSWDGAAQRREAMPAYTKVQKESRKKRVRCMRYVCKCGRCDSSGINIWICGIGQKDEYMKDEYIKSYRQPALCAGYMVEVVAGQQHHLV
jgi:hypothetical protein